MPKGGAGLFIIYLVGQDGQIADKADHLRRHDWPDGGNCVRPIKKTRSHTTQLDRFSRTQFFSKISHMRRHPDENKFPGEQQPRKKKISGETHTHTHWMNDGVQLLLNGENKEKATGLCGAQTNPADEIDFFRSLYTHTHTRRRKHTHIRRMHTFKWLYEIGQETILLTLYTKVSR
jgi:hypothetical protein